MLAARLARFGSATRLFGKVQLLGAAGEMIPVVLRRPVLKLATIGFAGGTAFVSMHHCVLHGCERGGRRGS